MDKTLRSILWILVALVLLSSFSAGWFFVAKERLYDEYVSLENLFKTTVDRLNIDLAVSNKKNTELDTRLAAIEKEMTALEAKNRDLEFRYKEAMTEKTELDEDLVRTRKAKVFLEKKLKEAESDKFVAGLLKEKTALEVELDRLKGSVTPKELEIERLKQENMNLGMTISGLREEKSLLHEKLEDSSKVSQMLSMDLSKEKGKIDADKEEFEKSKIENKVLKTRVAELEKAVDKFDGLTAEKDDMILKISKLEREVQYKEEEIDRLKVAMSETREPRGRELRAEAYHAPSQVDLPPIVLKREDSSGNTSRITTASLERISSPSSLEGRIVTVNREHGFVVIDIGKEDGVNIGYSFNVYREDILIGLVEVIQVRDRIAAADIKEIREGLSMEVDDVIVKR